MNDIAERLAARAAQVLRRPGAWLATSGDGYAVRGSADRRRRSLLTLDEAAFAALARTPGLKARPDGGWTLAARPAPPPPDRAGRPGMIEGERAVVEDDGRLTPRRVNLGESPVAWLARRKDAAGRPWLDPREAAAGERLREDFHRAGLIGRMTMSWDAGPRSRGGRSAGLEPAERARAAKARIAAALEAAGPGLRGVLEQVCLAGSALEAAERALGLPRRSGKTLLKLALGRLADHYRIG
ncbi:MAG: hypothetical protein IT546_08410 [Caulobacteraceae bacterium]|nr:hypothetical protein [Caulobacteraceae bacterium]